MDDEKDSLKYSIKVMIKNNLDTFDEPWEKGMLNEHRILKHLMSTLNGSTPINLGFPELHYFYDRAHLVRKKSNMFGKIGFGFGK